MKPKTLPGRILKSLPEILAGVALFTIVFMETVQAIYRYTMKHTFIFVDDVAVVCFAWAIFAGAAAAYREKMHYGLDVVVNAVPAKHKAKYMIILDTLITLTFGYFLYYSFILFKNAGPKILMTTGISYRWIDGALVYGFLMMLIYSIEFLVEEIKNVKVQKAEQEGVK